MPECYPGLEARRRGPRSPERSGAIPKGERSEAPPDHRLGAPAAAPSSPGGCGDIDHLGVAPTGVWGKATDEPAAGRGARGQRAVAPIAESRAQV